MWQFCYDKFAVSDTYWSQGSPSIFMVTAFGDMGLDNAVNICQLPPHPHCITLKKMAALFIWTSTGWLLCEYEFIKKNTFAIVGTCLCVLVFMFVTLLRVHLCAHLCEFVCSFMWICVFIYVNLSGWRFSFWAYVCVGVCLSAFSLIHLIRFLLIHSLYLWKKVLCFSPHHSVCLSVCVRVCVCVCVCVSFIKFVTKWLDLSTRHQVRLLPLTIAQHCNTIKIIRFRFRFIWAIKTKSHYGPNSWTDSHQTSTACSLTQRTTYILRFLRSIDRSRFYAHFSDHWSSPKN